jgi:hypothetical protein
VFYQFYTGNNLQLSTELLEGQKYDISFNDGRKECANKMVKGDNEPLSPFTLFPEIFIRKNYLLSSLSSETVKLFRPLALLAFKIFLPFFVAIRALKPCLLTLFRLDG